MPLADLRNILLYHVAPGRRDAAAVTGATRIRMANGRFTIITLNGGDALVNGAKILPPDQEAGNGIIHVIDGVLQP